MAKLFMCVKGAETASSYHSLEVLAGLFIEAAGFQGTNILALFLLGFNGFLFSAHLGIYLNVELEEVINGVLLERLLISVSFVRQSEQPVLLSPVSKVYESQSAPEPEGT